MSELDHDGYGTIYKLGHGNGHSYIFEYPEFTGGSYGDASGKGFPDYSGYGDGYGCSYENLVGNGKGIAHGHGDYDFCGNCFGQTY